PEPEACGSWFEADVPEAGGRPTSDPGPLAVPCWRCRAQAGQKCRNYLGQNKQTCPERGQPRPTPPPAPRQVAGLFDTADRGGTFDAFEVSSGADPGL